MKKYILSIVLLSALLISGCQNGADAYGNFEATEITVSSELPGKLLAFEIEEGQMLEVGQKVGYVDTLQLVLKKKQLQAKRSAISSKTSNVFAQLEVLKEELRVLDTERIRIEKLVKAEAATPQQLDNLTGKISVNRSRAKSIETQNASVVSEVKSIDFQIAQLEDQMRRGTIINPVKGTVLLKMVEPSEMVAPGRALYKIAPLENLYLRAYLSGSQLAQVKIGQEVTVRIDEGVEAFRSLKGKITWISQQAEFTPKIVQTKEERVNLVYAFKVKVANDGSLKIGMPGEVILPSSAGNTNQTAESKVQ